MIYDLHSNEYLLYFRLNKFLFHVNLAKLVPEIYDNESKRSKINQKHILKKEKQRLSDAQLSGSSCPIGEIFSCSLIHILFLMLGTITIQLVAQRTDAYTQQCSSIGLVIIGGFKSLKDQLFFHRFQIKADGLILSVLF